MAPALPQNLGRYEVLEELGRGAMGVVYLARDPLIGRLVAIKTFRSLYAPDDPEVREFRTRFIREAQSAGILSHPNIVTIHDVVDGSEEGVTFIAMEYVEGTNLKDLLQDSGQPLTLSRAVEIIGQVAQGLDYAHSRGVIHRDIKPANIIIDGAGRVKLTDFGIARMETSDLTQEGQLLGTPNYMAPERIQGRPVDHRTDIFSLGVVFYEMLTRRKPFQGDNLTMVSHRIVYEPFTPPGELVPELPQQVVEVLSRALAKTPAERFASAGEMARELERAAHGRGALALPPPIVEPPDAGAATQDVGGLSDTQVAPSIHEASASGSSSRGTRTASRRLLQRPAAIAAAAVLLVVLLAAAGAALWSRRPEPLPAPPSAAEQNRAEVRSLVAHAREELAAGRPEVAAGHLVRAMSLEPGDAEAAALQQRVVRSIEERRLSEAREAQLQELFDEAREEAAAGRHTEALRLADQLLALEPDSEEASALQQEARSALERRERQRAERLQHEEAARAAAAVAETAAATLEEPATEAAEPPREPVGQGTLVVSFYTEISEGVLTLYADQQQLLREPFSFSRRGLLRNEPRAGRIDARSTLPAGDRVLRVYVSVGGKASQVQTVPARLRPGGEVTLQIHLAADGTLSSWMEE